MFMYTSDKVKQAPNSITTEYIFVFWYNDHDYESENQRQPDVFARLTNFSGSIRIDGGLFGIKLKVDTDKVKQAPDSFTTQYTFVFQYNDHEYESENWRQPHVFARFTNFSRSTHIEGGLFGNKLKVLISR